MKARHLLCLAALGLAAVGSAQAQAASTIAIHYNRCDAAYDGWGLHTWKDGGTPLPGIDWKTPMAPTAKDDFGVTWQMSADAYGRGKVNYIIHKGDTKDQGGSDMQFDGTASPQIWVNNGDRTIYTSLDDATKARAAKPCP